MMKIGTRVYVKGEENTDMYEEFTIISRGVREDGLLWYGVRADDGRRFWFTKSALRKVVK